MSETERERDTHHRVDLSIARRSSIKQANGSLSLIERTVIRIRANIKTLGFYFVTAILVCSVALFFLHPTLRARVVVGWVLKTHDWDLGRRRQCDFETIFRGTNYFTY